MCWPHTQWSSNACSCDGVNVQSKSINTQKFPIWWTNAWEEKAGGHFRGLLRLVLDLVELSWTSKRKLPVVDNKIRSKSRAGSSGWKKHASLMLQQQQTASCLERHCGVCAKKYFSYRSALGVWTSCFGDGLSVYAGFCFRSIVVIYVKSCSCNNIKILSCGYDGKWSFKADKYSQVRCLFSCFARWSLGLRANIFS